MSIANTSSGDTFYTWRINTNKMSAFFNNAGGDHKFTQNYSRTSGNSTTGSIVTAGGIGVANNISVDGFVGVTPTSSIRISTGTQAQRPSSASEGMVRFNTDAHKIEYYDAQVASWRSIGSQLEDTDQDTKITVDTDDTDEDTVRIFIGNTSTQSASSLVIDRRTSDTTFTLDGNFTTNEFYGYLKVPVNDSTGPSDTGTDGIGSPGMIRYDAARGFEGYNNTNSNWTNFNSFVDSENGQDTFISQYGANSPHLVSSSSDDNSTNDMIRFWIGNTSNISTEALRIDRRTSDNGYTLDEENPTTEVYGFFRVPTSGETGPADSGKTGNGVPGMIRYATERGFEGYNDISNTWLDLSGMNDGDYDTRITLDTVNSDDEDHIRFYIGGTESVQKMSINSTSTYIDTDVRITGDLQVTGTTTTVGAQNLSVQDNLIYLNGPGDINTTFAGTGQNTATFYGYYEGTGTVTYKVEIVGNTSSPNTFRWYKDSVEQANNISITGINQELDNNIHIRFDNGLTGWSNTDYWEVTVSPIFSDLGFVGNYNDGVNPYAHAGFFYDASDSTWKIFDGLQSEPGSDINISGTGYSLGDLDVKDIEVTGNVYVSRYLIHSGDTNNYLDWGTDTLNIYTNGTLGLSLTSDTTSLYHNGNQKLYTTLTGITVTGSVNETSSLAFKENIIPLQNSLSIIDKLQGVSFEWKDKKKFDERKHIGLIAENVKEVVPEAEFEGTVSYTKLVGLLIEGIKELKKELDILKGK